VPRQRAIKPVEEHIRRDGGGDGESRVGRVQDEQEGGQRQEDTRIVADVGVVEEHVGEALADADEAELAARLARRRLPLAKRRVQENFSCHGIQFFF